MLNKLAEGEYESEPLDADENESMLSVQVNGNEIEKCAVQWKKAAQEEDLFDF